MMLLAQGDKQGQSPLQPPIHSLASTLESFLDIFMTPPRIRTEPAFASRFSPKPISVAMRAQLPAGPEVSPGILEGGGAWIM